MQKYERILIKDQDLSEVADLVGKDVPAAILLNCDDWGYGHFIMDEAAIKVFEEKLSRV